LFLLESPQKAQQWMRNDVIGDRIAENSGVYEAEELETIGQKQEIWEKRIHERESDGRHTAGAILPCY
jgi:hypothetical protein